jgi:beta-N-acetylhexosaminidase
VREGRLAEETLAVAAARVATTNAPAASHRADAQAFVTLGLAAARRAVRGQGEVATKGPILVVELEGSLSVAAGPISHDLATILRELGADVETVRVSEDEASHAPALVAAHPARRLVVVVRDVDRHPWQEATVLGLSRTCPDAVVVDVGYPAGALPPGAGRITTFGVGRAALTAAAELLL